MFCKNCGSQLSDDAKFCEYCGTPIEVAEDVQTNTPEPEFIQTEPTSSQARAVNDPSLPSLGSILGFGIASVATCEFGIPGIIFGAIGKSKAKQVLNGGGALGGQGKAGNIMSKVGLIIGIVMTVIWTIYVLIVGIAACSLNLYF